MIGKHLHLRHSEFTNSWTDYKTIWSVEINTAATSVSYIPLESTCAISASTFQLLHAALKFLKDFKKIYFSKKFDNMEWLLT